MTRPSLHRWSRRQILASGAGLALSLGFPRRVLAGSASRNLIIWWNNGGWDPTFVFDPHFEANGLARDPNSTLASAGGISFADAESRPAVRAYFERWGHRSCVINGLSVGSISHDGCSRLVLTGVRVGGADLGTLVASQSLGSRPLPFVSLGGPRYPGQQGEVLTPVGPLLSGFVQDTEPAHADIDATREELLLEYIQREAELRTNQPYLDSWSQAVERLRVLRQQPDLLNIGANPTEEELISMGIELLATQTCSVLGLQAPLPSLVRWDSHDQNQENQEQAFESSFSHLDTLLTTLATTEDGDGTLLDHTTVLVLSEMGRTPRLNPSMGKDHWPYTSAMVVGAGVGGGRVVGVSNETLVVQKVDFSSGASSSSGSTLFPQNLVAGVLQSFDIDPGGPLPGVAPFTAWQD